MRAILIGLLAISLPTVIFAAVLIAANAYNSRSSVEAVALDQARQIVNDVDAELARSTGVLEVFATSIAIRRNDWNDARNRAAVIVNLNPNWRSATLIDLENSRVVLTTSRDAVPASMLQFARSLPAKTVGYGEIDRRPGRCTCVLIGERIPGQGQRLALVIEVDPASIQQAMLEETPRGAVSAVVDRRGRFIGRSVDYANRVGTFATVYVRSTLRREPEGYYKGKTYEGLVNYTAYVRSPVTGWSSHVAVSSALIAEPQHRFFIAVGLAATLALAFSLLAGIVWLRNFQVRRNAEARLAEAQHMEALGRLAGGIAHDFNNMLAIVSGNIGLVRRSASLSEKEARQLEAASQGAKRAADLTRRMLAYAKRQKLRPEIMDCREVVRDVCGLLERTIGDHIEFECSADDCVWAVNVDRSALENAIMNLAINARDSVPEGGKIAILARDCPAGEDVGGHRVDTDSVCFSVADTGVGIPEDLLGRVTDPFFTTKGTDGGTGLGLSQVKGFVEQSGGEMRIVSREDEGTTVFLVLPRAHPQASATQAMPSHENFPLRNLRILVIEDDTDVLATTVDMLRELGHTPVPYSSPEEALATLPHEHYDAVITDNQMPGMFGTELIERIRQLGLSMPAILVSALEPDTNESSTRVLAKPFSSHELAAALASLASDMLARNA